MGAGGRESNIVHWHYDELMKSKQSKTKKPGRRGMLPRGVAELTCERENPFGCAHVEVFVLQIWSNRETVLK